MIRSTLLLLLAVLACAADPGTVASPFAEAFFREKVEPVLVEHCYECHGNGRHKGGLSMATPQEFLEGGNEGVALIPGDSAKSPVITFIRWEAEDEELNMPPKAKMPEQAIADLTRWVEMGAPWPTTPAGTAAAAPPMAKALPPAVGRLHPVVVHFPIACLLLAVLAEALVAWRGATWRPVTTFLVLVGAAGAIAAVISGSLLAQEETPAIERHQLLGWITLVGALLSSVLLWVPRRWILRAALLLTAVLATLTGHLGGELVYGTGWLSF